MDENIRQPLLSIIVPVYNTEEYLGDCLESILNQTFAEFELLLVNDGSTDSSGAICNQYAANDSRVKVFHKENEGVSAARNFGLANAKGKYVWFVDSDDIVNKEIIAGIAESGFFGEEIDLIQFGYSKFSGKNNPDFNKCGIPSFHNYSPQEYFSLNYVPNALFIKILRKSNIDAGNILFESGLKFGEDLLFTVRYLSNASGYAVIPECGYYYRQHAQSAMSRAHTPSEALDHIVVLRELSVELCRIAGMTNEPLKKFIRDTIKRTTRTCVAFSAISVKGMDLKLLQREYNALYDNFFKKDNSLQNNLILKANRVSVIPMFLFYKLLTALGRYR